MIELIAKENATIAYKNNTFPLGQRGQIKITIEDPNIIDYINGIHTYTCISENNLYSYGDFNCDSDIKNLVLDLKKDSSVSITSGYGINYSRCLKCESGGTSLGLCLLKPNMNKLTIGKKYILSFYINCPTDTFDSLNIEANSYNITDFDTNKDSEWQFIKYEFEADSEDFVLSIDILKANSIIYIDNVELFLSDDEIINNSFDELGFEIQILNPLQNTEITEVINYSKPEDEEKYIILYLPEITTVDIQDNLLCKFNINLLSEPKNKYLGNTTYFKVKDCIYSSDPFILNGYIILDTDIKLEVEEI